MSSPSYKTIIYKPMLVKPPSTKLKQLPRFNSRSASRFFIFLLAFWTCLNISRRLLLPPPPVCSDQQRRGSFAKDRLVDEFWQWSNSSGILRLKPCLNFSEPYVDLSKKLAHAERKYMTATVSGGLNQQRNQIIDAVVIARILGAVLVLPVLQVNQVWGDESEFADLFDEQHFKKTLRDDVVVVSSLPATHLQKRKIRSQAMPFNSDENWIRAHYIRKLSKDSVFHLRAFDSRLSRDLNSDLQKLRCKVAYQALKFQPWIENIAGKLVNRMQEEGPYMALHLRLEKDVWIRTGCLMGVSKEDDLVIEQERAAKPQLLTSRSKLNPQERYIAGLCPLNSIQVARLLNGLGVPKNTHIYWAGGEPFGGGQALEPLKVGFSNLYNKWSLARPGELEDIRHKPSVLAALDYVVCLKSQVFMANHGGNMARSLQGHRIYMGYGKHIKPNKKLLVHLFINKKLSDAEIDVRIKKSHRNSSDAAFRGGSKLGKDVIAFPVRYCMCNGGGTEI